MCIVPSRDPTPPSARRHRRLRFHDDSSDSTSDVDPPEDMLMRLLEDLRLGWRQEERWDGMGTGSDITLYVAAGMKTVYSAMKTWIVSEDPPF